VKYKVKYIFKGKVIEGFYYIKEYDIKFRVDNEKGCTEQVLQFMRLYNPVEYPHFYFSYVSKIKEWQTFSENNKIEYKIEKGSKVKLGGLTFTVEEVEINAHDGSVTCYTDHIVERITGQECSSDWAEAEVIRIYNELKLERDMESQSCDDDEDEELSFWQHIKLIFTGRR
jgi:hypothetical protein